MRRTMNQTEKKTFTRDVSKTYFSQKGGEEGYLADVMVTVERVRPVIRNGNEPPKRLSERVELTITRRRRSTSFRLNEAKALKELIEEALPHLEKADAGMREERDTWQEQQRYQPRKQEDFSMGRGKTERNRKKGKARAKKWDTDGNR
jgi:hypothetical protein